MPHQSMVHVNQSREWVDPSTAFHISTTKPPDTMSFGAIRMKEQIRFMGDNHLKPPAPNEVTGERLNEEYEDAKEDDDEMVADTPQHRQ
ncbi:hypothetical protein A2U01_0059822 [Trifolium medium]|uniref:Uncharacterized protein n=1 Tax=Trifolium medium TaxID=97028 RepID=A0A392RR78_9FABA|nr:hypothetical protein [Trifolium medium]